VGKVFDPGSVPNLLLTGNFFYWGPQWSLTAAGLQGGLLEPLTLNVSYYYLYGESGQFDHINSFKAELGYKLTKDANVQLNLSYERGRDLEKFDDRDLWKTSLGYKF
jgi:predicted porin